MKKANSYYTNTTWRKVRDNAIKENIINNGGVCAICGKVYPSNKMVVHHKDHLKEGDEYNLDKLYDSSNLEVVCCYCHNKIHKRFNTTIKKKVYIVWGSPMSGKSSYVRENMHYGDLVIDLDNLFSAISYHELYDKPDNLKYNVFPLRDNLIKQIQDRKGYWTNAWIIGGYANTYERESLAKKLHATTVYMNTSKEECLLRLESCNDNRAQDVDSYRKIINDWWARATPPYRRQF